jgi:response regulator RpfG family c-di-GMP phosphodiesterase
MHCLLLIEDKSIQTLVSNLLMTHLRLKSVAVEDFAGVMAQFSGNPPPVFSIIACEAQSYDPKTIFDKINEISKQAPCLYIGHQNVLPILCPANLFEVNNKNDQIVLPLDSEESIENFKAILKPLVEHFTNLEILAEETIADDIDAYLPIKLKNFYRFQYSPYDIYLSLSDQHFVKIVNKDEIFGTSSIKKYLQRNIKFVYIKKNEHLHFLSQVCNNLITDFTSIKLNPLQALITQKKASSMIHEHIRTIGVSEDVVKLTKLTLDSLFRTALEIGNIREFFRLFPLEFGDPSERSILTCYVALYLLEELNWTSDLVKKKVGLAAILHDSLFTNDDMIFILSRDDHEFNLFSKEEQKTFLHHPIRASELAPFFSGFSDTEFIIQQHHELPNGLGFPAGLSSSEVTPLSCIFIVANNFINFLSKEDEINTQTVKNSLLSIYEHYLVGNYRDPMKALFKIITGKTAKT